MANNEYEIPGQWWTAPAEAEDGRLIMVTGRKDVDKFRDSGKFNIRVTVAWPYTSADGMPAEADAQLMQQALEALCTEFKRDPVAVLTGIYTGANMREMVFYTRSIHIFGRKLNEILQPLPVLPLQISAENDPDWAEYAEMSQLEVADDSDILD